MRILTLSCLLFLLTACSLAQDTNFAAGPQYLLTGSPLLSRSIATPTLSLDAPLPPVESASINIPEAAAPAASGVPTPAAAEFATQVAPEVAPEVAPAANPQPEHQADLIPIYYGVDSHYRASTAGTVEIGVPEEAAESSTALPASIVESGVTELVDAQALRLRGHGVTVAEAAAYWKSHKPPTRRNFTNEDVKRLHAAS